MLPVVLVLSSSVPRAHVVEDPAGGKYIFLRWIECADIYSGSTPAHCGTGCQSAYGKCEGADINSSFQKALKDGRTDKMNGGQWYWDSETRIFWSWDTPELIAQKIALMAETRGVKSVMAWALALDSYDWSHLKAMQKGFKTVNGL